MLGAALGPVLGGVLTQLFDWRAIFVVQAPIAGAALLATAAGRGPARRGAAGRRRRAARSPPTPRSLLALRRARRRALPRRAARDHGLGARADRRRARRQRPAGRDARRAAARAGARAARGGVGRGGPARGRARVPRAPAARLERCSSRSRSRSAAPGSGSRCRCSRAGRSTRTPGSSAAARSRSPPATPGSCSALALVAPLLTSVARHAPGERALLGGTKAILDANVPLPEEGADRARAARRARVGAEGRGAGPRQAVRRRRRATTTTTCARPATRWSITLESALTRGFRSAFALAALFAALALIPALRLRRREMKAARRACSRPRPRADRRRALARRGRVRQAEARRPVHVEAGVQGRRHRRRDPAVRAQRPERRRLQAAHDPRGARALVRPRSGHEARALGPADDRRRAQGRVRPGVQGHRAPRRGRLRDRPHPRGRRRRAA